MSNQEPTPKQCDLCDGDRFEILGRQDRAGQELLTDVCVACGLVSHRCIPSDEELAEFYAVDYRRQYHGELTPSARRVMRAWKNGRRIHRQLAPWLKPGANVLEVGAGIGCTVKVFQEQGCLAQGIEPNHGFQRFAEHRLHAAVRDAYLFDLPPAPRHDMVLLVHVIEHLRSPRAALEHLHRLLQPQGLLYVECPNLGAPFARRRKLFHFAHIHNFTPDTLAAMGRRCGFEVERWISLPTDPDLQVLLRRADAGRLEIDAHGYRRTREAVDRYNVLTYHLRPRYLSKRLRKLASYLQEHLFAERRMRELLAGAARTPALRDRPATSHRAAA